MPRPRIAFGRRPRPGRTAGADLLRLESVGGLLLLLGALLGLLAANLATGWYTSLSGTVVGPSLAHLDLTLAHWAADGLLAIFFYIAGVEVKRELAVGSLSKPSAAAVPVVAAVCGMVVPALLYLLVAASTPGARDGWGIPMATDIAFAVAILAVAGSQLPSSLRVFLLTIAVVDDLGAILVIALFYTATLAFGWLLASAALLACFAWLQRRRVTSVWVYAPLGFAAWTCMHASGVHATVAGVALGLLTRARRDEGEAASPGDRVQHRLQPFSAAVAVPVFAFFSAGIVLSGSMFAGAIKDPAAQGVVLGLVVGKVIGVFGGTVLTLRLTRSALAHGLGRPDLLAVAVLAGVGFTVSLLISELAFAGQPERLEHVKAAVLVASLVAGGLAVVLLRLRVRAHTRPAEPARPA